MLPADEVSDHDATYIFINVKPDRFKKCYKYIRNIKTFDANLYVKDFQTLPFNVVYALDDPEEKLSIFNDLTKECIDRHAPLIRTKITRAPAPWMRDPAIQEEL